MDNQAKTTPAVPNTADQILDVDISTLDVFSKGRERVNVGNDFSEHQATTGPGGDPINM